MKLCLGCMSKMEDNRWNCPNCGFDEKKYRPDPACLQIGTVIGGKYIVGKCLKIDDDSISYLGWDAEREKKLEIDEFFPRDYSYRDPGETEIGIYAGDAVDLYERRMNQFLSGSSLTLKENNTGYIIKDYVAVKPSEPATKKKRKNYFALILAAVVVLIIIGGVSWFLFFRQSGDVGTPGPSVVPIATTEPTAESTATPRPTEEPTATPESTKTKKPKSTRKPKSTKKPESTKEPVATPKPTKKPTEVVQIESL